VVSVMGSIRPAVTKAVSSAGVDPNAAPESIEPDPTFGNEAADVARAHPDPVGGLLDG